MFWAVLTLLLISVYPDIIIVIVIVLGQTSYLYLCCLYVFNMLLVLVMNVIDIKGSGHKMPC